jgi:nucleoside triphosphate diphosphatase
MTKQILQSEQSLARIIKVMQQLRDPDSGCPWDRKQSWRSLIPYTIEEAYEVADAIENTSDLEQAETLKGELGDLFFQVVFYAQIAQEQGHFDLHDVIEQLCDKLEVRHPHVFADACIENKAQLEAAWHKAKAADRAKRDLGSVLDDIPLALPALTRAQKVQRRAANEGFDWPDSSGVFEKLDEELNELKEAINAKDIDAIEDELGDMFFTLVNLARHLEQDAESALRRATNKFERRYRALEEQLTEQGKVVNQLSLEQLEALWQSVK